MKDAFSYIRFSSPEQAKGDSFRRQSEKAEAWAKANGYRIVKSWEDLGVSSYRGQNAAKGGFGEFLRAAHAGELPKDSVLLVENLDRVSRQTPRKALSRFLDLIDIGIGVVTLTDGEKYTAESLDEDKTGMKLFGSLMVMIRANNESRVKGERVAAAWERKRLAAREKSHRLSDRIPGWLTPGRDEAGRRTLAENEKRVEIVRRIFDETVQGFGRRAIAKGLNRDGKLSFLSETGWQPSSVIKIIRSRTAMGEYQPHKRAENGRRIPDGDPIKDYYPAVIDEGLWLQANAAVTVRRKDGGGRPQAEVANLVRGLAHCACGKGMLFLNKGKPPKGGRYYVCSAAARDDGCDNKRLWNTRDVERYVLRQVDPARIAAAFEPAAKRQGPSPKELSMQIAELTAMRASALDLVLRNQGKRVASVYEDRVEFYNEEIERLRERRDAAAAAEHSRPHLPTTQSALGSVAALAAKLETASEAERGPLRVSIVQQLRTAFAEIVFRPHAIVGLVELPEKPKIRKLGFPTTGIEIRPPGKPKIGRKGRGASPVGIEARQSKESERERYFLRHVFFRDDPEEMASLGGGKGIVFPRFT
jgi:DNA invertase Pin-like site-specific DNA recombinase